MEWYLNIDPNSPVWQDSYISQEELEDLEDAEGDYRNDCEKEDKLNN